MLLGISPQYNREGAVTYLCRKKGLVINQRSYDGCTPLLLLLRKKLLDWSPYLDVLLRHGADTSATMEVEEEGGRVVTRSALHYLRVWYKSYTHTSKEQINCHSKLLRRLFLTTKYARLWHLNLHRRHLEVHKRKSNDSLEFIHNNPYFNHTTIANFMGTYLGDTGAGIQAMLEIPIIHTKRELVHNRRRILRKLRRMAMETLEQ